MASDLLDKQWDGWMASLSENYIKTLDLLKEGKTKDASDLFEKEFVPTVKKAYSEVAEVYPVRFSKTDNWCVWTKQLYILTGMTERALSKKDIDDAFMFLAVLREHFNVLHQKADYRKSNDYIYICYLKLNGDDPVLSRIPAIREKLEKSTARAKAPSDCTEEEKKDPKSSKDQKPKIEIDEKAPMVDQMKAIYSLVESATPSGRAKMDADAYKNAKLEWSSGVSAVLADGKIDPEEMGPLRKKTEKFYREFGIHFE